MPPWKFEQEMSFILPFLDMRKTQSNLEDEELQDVDELVEHVIIGDPRTIAHDRSVDSMNIPNDEVNASRNVPSIGGINKRKRNGQDNAIHEMVEVMREKAAMRQIRHDEKKLSAQDLDETDMFFLSLASATKSLPLLEQAKVKLQVSQTVFNAQIAFGEQIQYLGSSHSPASYILTNSETPFPQRPSSAASASTCSSESGGYAVTLGSDPMGRDYLRPRVCSPPNLLDTSGDQKT